MHKWYVAQTNPQQEFKAQMNLRRQDYETWLPCFKKTRRHARRVDEVLRPLFPGYLFVNMDVEASRWRSINGTYGVRQLICQDSRPVPVADRFVQDLQAAAQDGALFETPEEFKAGEEVRITGGAFESCLGTITQLSDKDRVTILLSFLGREVETLIPRHYIQATA